MTTVQPDETEVAMEAAIPQIMILESIQRNDWSDVALHNIGHLILMTAIRGNPMLNKHELFSATVVNASYNAQYERFRTRSVAAVVAFPLYDLLSGFNTVVGYVEEALLRQLTLTRHTGYKFVAKSLLPIFRFHDDMQHFTMGLIWFEEKEGDVTDDKNSEPGTGGTNVRGSPTEPGT